MMIPRVIWPCFPGPIFQKAQQYRPIAMDLCCPCAGAIVQSTSHIRKLGLHFCSNYHDQHRRRIARLISR